MQIEFCPRSLITYEPFVHNPEKHTTCPVHVVTRLGSSRELFTINDYTALCRLNFALVAQLFMNPLFINPEKHTTCPVHVVTRLGSSRELKPS